MRTSQLRLLAHGCFSNLLASVGSRGAGIGRPLRALDRPDRLEVMAVQLLAELGECAVQGAGALRFFDRDVEGLAAMAQLRLAAHLGLRATIGTGPHRSSPTTSSNPPRTAEP